MNPGSKPDPHDKIVAEAIAQFREGRAYEFTYAGENTPRGSTGLIQIVLIPEPLFRPHGADLLVVVLGRGSVMWNGTDRMNAFNLISQGVRPMGLAKELAVVLNRIANEMGAYVPVSPPETLRIENHGD